MRVAPLGQSWLDDVSGVKFLSRKEGSRRYSGSALECVRFVHTVKSNDPMGWKSPRSNRIGIGSVLVVGLITICLDSK